MPKIVTITVHLPTARAGARRAITVCTRMYLSIPAMILAVLAVLADFAVLAVDTGVEFYHSNYLGVDN